MVARASPLRPPREDPMKFGYLLHKMRTLLRAKFLPWQGCASWGGAGRLKLQQHPRVVLDLGNPRFTHLGDQLFFVPLADALRSVCQLTVKPTRAMEWYFRALGYSVDVDADTGGFDLRITRLELFEPGLAIPQIVVNTVSGRITRRLGEQVVADVCGLLSITADMKAVRPPIPRGLPVPDRSLPGEGFIFYNPYVDSGWFRIRKGHREKLFSCALDLSARHGATLVLCGSEKEKKGDPILYPDRCLDLRGAISIPELAGLMDSPRCLGAVCFDTFIAHLCLMCRKRAWIMAKPRLRAKTRRFIERSVVPFWTQAPDENPVTWI